MLRAAPFTFGQHIPSFLMPPLAEPVWCFQAKNELAVLLDMEEATTEKPMKSYSTQAKLATMHTEKDYGKQKSCVDSYSDLHPAWPDKIKIP